jgi:hypothetical protein
VYIADKVITVSTNCNLEAAVVNAHPRTSTMRNPSTFKFSPAQESPSQLTYDDLSSHLKNLRRTLPLDRALKIDRIAYYLIDDTLCHGIKMCKWEIAAPEEIKTMVQIKIAETDSGYWAQVTMRSDGEDVDMDRSSDSFDEKMEDHISPPARRVAFSVKKANCANIQNYASSTSTNITFPLPKTQPAKPAIPSTVPPQHSQATHRSISPPPTPSELRSELLDALDRLPNDLSAIMTPKGIKRMQNILVGGLTRAEHSHDETGSAEIWRDVQRLSLQVADDDNRETERLSKEMDGEADIWEDMAEMTETSVVEKRDEKKRKRKNLSSPTSVLMPKNKRVRIQARHPADMKTTVPATLKELAFPK